MLKFLGGGKKKKSKSRHEGKNAEDVNDEISSVDESYSPSDTHRRGDSPISPGTATSIGSSLPSAERQDPTPSKLKRTLPQQQPSAPSSVNPSASSPSSLPSHQLKTGSQTAKASLSSNQKSLSSLPPSKSAPDLVRVPNHSELRSAVEEDESDDDASNIDEEKKEKKKGKFGLKIPKAIKGFASGSKSKGEEEKPLSIITTGSLSAQEFDRLHAENRRLKNSVEEMESYLTAKSFTLEQMQKARDDELKGHKEELSALTDRLERAMSRADEAERKIRENHSDFNHRVLVDEITTRNNVLQIHCVELEQEVAKLTKSSSEMTMEKNSLTRQIEQLTQGKIFVENELRGARAAQDEQMSRLMKDNEKLQLKNSELEKECDLLQLNLSQLENDVEHLETEKTTLEVAQHIAEQNRVSAAASQGDLQATIQRLIGEVAVLKETETQYDQERTRFREELIRTHHEKNSLELELVKQQQETNRMKETQQGEDRTSELKAEIERMKYETNTVYTDFQKILKQNTELLGVISEYRIANDELEEKAVMSLEKVLKLEEELATLRAKAASEANERTSAEIVADRVQELEKENATTREELCRSMAEITRLTQLEHQLKNEKENYKRESETISKQYSALQESLKKQSVNQSDEQALKEQIAQLEAAKAGMLSDLEGFKASQETVENARAKIAEDHQGTLMKLAAIEKEMSSVRTEQQSLACRLKKKEREVEERVEEVERLMQKDIAASKQLQEVRAKLKETETLKEDQYLDLIRLKAECESNAQVLEQRNKEVHELRQQLDQKKQQAKEVNQSIFESSAEVERLQTLLKKKETESAAKLRALQADLDSSTGRLRNAVAETQTLRTEVANVKLELVTTKEELDKLISEREQLTRRSSVLDGETKSLQSRFVARDVELKQAIVQIEQMKKDSNTLESRIQDLTAALDDAHQEALREKSQLQERLAQSEQNISNVRAELQSSRLEVSSLSSQLKSANMERDVLKATTTNLKDQLRMMTDSSSALTNNLSAKESDLQKQILELQGAKELQAVQLQAVTMRESRMREELREKIQDLETFRSQTETERFKGQARISELEVKNAELQRQNQSMQISCNSLLQDNLRSSSQWQNETDCYQTRIKMFEATVKNMEDKNNELRDRNEDLISKVDTLTSRQTENESHRRMLETQVRSLEDQLHVAKEAAAASSPSHLPSFGLNSGEIDSRSGQSARASLNSGPIPDTVEPGAKRVVGTLLSNSLIAGVEIPSKVALLEKSALDSYKSSDYRDVSVVCVLRSRLIECLFDKPNPGEPSWPTSLFGHIIPPSNKNSERERPMVARVLSRVANLWELGEDIRLALVQSDTGLSDRYLESKTASGDWIQTLESLRGSAQVLEERNKKLERLCNTYLFSAKEARAAAQLEREKCKQLNASFKKRFQLLSDSKEALNKENMKISDDLTKLKSGLDLTIEENLHLQESYAKYLTTLPYVKDTVDNLKEQVSRLSRSTESQSAPRLGIEKNPVLDENSPQAYTTGARPRAMSGNIPATSGKLSTHPTIQNSSHFYDLDDTPIQHASKVQLSDHFLRTPFIAPAIPAMTWSQRHDNSAFTYMTNSLKSQTSPIASSTLGRRSWPKNSTVSVIPAFLPSTSLARPSRIGIPSRSVREVTRSTSPLRLSPLSEMIMS